MNSNDLMIDLLSTHLGLSVSYQPESLSAVADVVPSLYVGMGGTICETAREIIQYKTGCLLSRVWIDGKTVSEVKI